MAPVAVVLALGLGLGIGRAVWGGANEGPSTLYGSNGSVQVQASYPAKIVFLGADKTSGCLVPVNGGARLCTAFAQLSSTRLAVGDVMNAVVMTVTNPNSRGYQFAALWPQKVTD